MFYIDVITCPCPKPDAGLTKFCQYKRPLDLMNIVTSTFLCNAFCLILLFINKTVQERNIVPLLLNQSSICLHKSIKLNTYPSFLKVFTIKQILTVVYQLSIGQFHGCYFLNWCIIRMYMRHYMHHCHQSTTRWTIVKFLCFFINLERYGHLSASLIHIYSGPVHKTRTWSSLALLTT